MENALTLSYLEFISADGDVLTTDSLKVAAVHGKRHDNVVSLIRRRLAESGKWGLLNFKEISYVDESGRTYPMFVMTQAGYQFLVGKMTGKKAVEHQIAFIEAFNAMAAHIKNQREGLTFKYFEADRKLKDRKSQASAAGRDLSLWKGDRPVLESKVNLILQELQPALFPH
jgi:Rha family phage regulatory protein